MKIKILVPIYNDWQSVFKLIDKIDNLLQAKYYNTDQTVQENLTSLISKLLKSLNNLKKDTENVPSPGSLASVGIGL